MLFHKIQGYGLRDEINSNILSVDSLFAS